MADHGPGVPISTATVVDGQVKYCVSGYAPRQSVVVVHSSARVQTRFRTGFRGSGCSSWSVPQGCSRPVEDAAVATGVGADGNPATSTATVRAPLSPTCSASPVPVHHDSALGGSVSLSSAGILLIGVAAIALAGLIVIGLVAARRRRSSSAD
jgi:hypothetical protein